MIFIEKAGHSQCHSSNNTVLTFALNNVENEKRWGNAEIVPTKHTKQNGKRAKSIRLLCRVKKQPFFDDTDTGVLG